MAFGGSESAYPVGKTNGDLRRHNRALVLELVRTRGPVSRADLTRLVCLSMPGVAELVDDLLRDGLVEEAGVGPSTGGRRPTLLRLVPKSRCAVGLSIGTRTLNAVVTDLDASVEARLTLPSEVARGQEALKEQVEDAVGRMLEEASGKLGGVLGIGLALPAPILAHEGGAFSPPSYPGWGRLQLDEFVAHRFGVRALVDNYANAVALGEHLFGVGRGVRNMFCVVLQRGVGGAAVIDGRLYRGANGGAGEIGDTLVDPAGPRCEECGKYGCLSAYVGRPAIARRAESALRLVGGREMAGRAPDRLKAEDVVEAALRGDNLARRVLEETGEYLGVGLANVVDLFDPELVVVGGPTMRAGSILLDPATRVVRQRAKPGLAERVRIVAGRLGADAGAVGAAALVLNKLFPISVPREEEPAASGHESDEASAG